MASNSLADLIVNKTENLDWILDALCGTELKSDGTPYTADDFFVEAGHTIAHETVELCRRCPVRTECLTHCYENERANGYYAGVSPGQRRRMTLAEALEYIANDPPVGR